MLGGHTYVVVVAVYNSAQYLSAFFATTGRSHHGSNQQDFVLASRQTLGLQCICTSTTCTGRTCVRTPQGFKSFAWCYMQRCTYVHYITLGLWRCNVSRKWLGGLKRTHRRDLRIYTHTLRTRRPLHALFQ